MPVDWFPLWWSLRAAVLSTIFALGIGLWLAWLLANCQFRGHGVPGRPRLNLRLAEDREIAGPYFPGRLIGDHGWLCVRPERLTAVPRDGRPGKIESPLCSLLHAPQFDSESLRAGKECRIEFPQQGLWLI